MTAYMFLAVIFNDSAMYDRMREVALPEGGNSGATREFCGLDSKFD